MWMKQKLVDGELVGSAGPASDDDAQLAFDQYGDVGDRLHYLKDGYFWQVWWQAEKGKVR